MHVHPKYIKSTQEMFVRLEEWSLEIEYPERPYQGRGYYDFKTPVRRDLVSSPIATEDVQRQFVKMVVSAAQRLATLKPDHLSSTRVVAAFNYPDLFHSQIDVFFDANYWDQFRDRNSHEQTWTPLVEHESFLGKFSISIPPQFRELGYHFIHRDDSLDPPYDIETGEYWFLSEKLITVS